MIFVLLTSLCFWSEVYAIIKRALILLFFKKSWTVRLRGLFITLNELRNFQVVLKDCSAFRLNYAVLEVLRKEFSNDACEINEIF
jgi:hypothetical protein